MIFVWNIWVNLGFEIGIDGLVWLNLTTFELMMLEWGFPTIIDQFIWNSSLDASNDCIKLKIENMKIPFIIFPKMNSINCWNLDQKWKINQRIFRKLNNTKLDWISQNSHYFWNLYDWNMLSEQNWLNFLFSILILNLILIFNFNFVLCLQWNENLNYFTSDFSFFGKSNSGKI